MGTRSLTYCYDSFKHEPIIALYRQFDGYPEGHGADLAEFLDGFNIVNGLGRDTPTKTANGMGCLAAQLVAHFKTEAGQFYLEIPNLELPAGQEYEYHVYKDKVEIYKNWTDTTIFSGTYAELKEFCKPPEQEPNVFISKKKLTAMDN